MFIIDKADHGAGNRARYTVATNRIISIHLLFAIEGIN